MAASGRRSVTLLCVCSVVVVLLLLVDGTTALEPQAGTLGNGIVGSTKEFYLRGNPTMSTEAEESLEALARRDLIDTLDYTPTSNCDTNETNKGSCP